jgi:hypothetical protein
LHWQSVNILHSRGRQWIQEWRHIRLIQVRTQQKPALFQFGKGMPKTRYRTPKMNLQARNSSSGHRLVLLCCLILWSSAYSGEDTAETSTIWNVAEWNASSSDVLWPMMRPRCHCSRPACTFPNTLDLGTLCTISPSSPLQAIKPMWSSKLSIYMEFDEA